MEMNEKLRAFLASKEHRFHAMGDYPNVISGKLARTYEPLARTGMIGARVSPQGIARVFSDQAWVVMLEKQSLISRQTAKTLLLALEEAKKEPGFGGEDWLKAYLNGDEDTASAVNLGRTLQEPMSRIQLRGLLNEFIGMALQFIEKLLDFAGDHTDLIMPGHTHMSQAQPTTYGAYLVAICDGLLRGMEQVELAYRQNNLCSAGCGALAGTGWPVDRYYVAELLGFDDLIGSSVDCEAGQDYATSILFALSNMALVMSRTSMDHEIWGLEEVGHFSVNGCVAGPSSLMPQKAHPGGELEKIRYYANDVLNAMHRGVLSLKGEPYEDLLTIYQAWNAAESAMYAFMIIFELFPKYLDNMRFDKERMLRNTAEGYSCMPDLAVYLIRNRGIGGRRAHRMCAITVFLARERKIKGNEITAGLFNEALELGGEAARDLLTTQEIRECLDPEAFIRRHDNVGDPHPDEVARQIAQRREQLRAFRARHQGRLDRLAKADETLQKAIQAITA